MQKKRLIFWIYISACIACIVLPSAYFLSKFFVEHRAPLPEHGKWKNESHEILVDFDAGTVIIEEIYIGELTVSEPDFLDARVPMEGPVEGTVGSRGLMGHCIEATESGFRIQSTKNKESWWFYKVG